MVHPNTNRITGNYSNYLAALKGPLEGYLNKKGSPPNVNEHINSAFYLHFNSEGNLRYRAYLCTYFQIMQIPSTIFQHYWDEKCP